ncbi:MAG: branched-chain amino acid transport system ATP-binding protein livF [Frankiaceae bacterium]|jgi:branched-chain amino acid transport system ATP-binding protein|nr:branched-chain amino acid transport system ATP-binding protein livF [Frankiaceae bacterium]MDX6224214.1 branched-chain amino acid transport system ATP-binding protein livF [Frankiales bacterium]
MSEGALSRTEPTAAEGAPLLSVRDVTAGFGATTVLHGISFDVVPGEVCGIFGLNGAGKSVTMGVLAGIIPARSGRIVYNGRDVTAMSAEHRVALGWGHVPQGRQVFPQLTVEENLRLGAFTLRRRNKSRYPAVLTSVLERFPILAERRTQLAGTMSGGQQASLAVARALMSEPTLLFVDEPSAGLSPLAIRDLFTALKAVADTGVSMVLVEQNVAFGLQIVDTVHVLQTGQVKLAKAVQDVDAGELGERLGVGRLLGAGIEQVLASRKGDSRG